MNQSELIATVADHAGITQKQAETAIKHIGSLVQGAVKNNDELTLPGIGKFGAKAVPGRMGRNPATGDAIEIAAKTKPTFTAAKALKDAANA